MPENKRAVIIGINDYGGTGLDDLKGAVNDATDMRQRLEEFGKFEVADNHFLLDKEATHDAIQKAVSDLLWKTDPCDVALFYFSGHGVVDGYNNGYIAPCDMTKDEPFVRGILLHNLKQVLWDSTSKASVMILDACYSGGAAEAKSPANVKEAYRIFEELEEEEKGEGKVVLTSTDDQSVAREKPNCKHEGENIDHHHGAFTFHLIEGLDGKASNESGIITLGELIKHVDKQFGGSAKQKPRHMFSKGFQLEDVRIAVTPQKHKDYIERLLKEVELCPENDPASQFIAADRIKRVLATGFENDVTRSYKTDINDRLEKWQEYAGGWLGRNKDVAIEIVVSKQMRFEIIPVWQRMEALVPRLNFDDINTCNREEKQLLSNLCDVCEIDDSDPKVVTTDPRIENFILRCKGYQTNPSSTPSTPKPPSTRTPGRPSSS